MAGKRVHAVGGGPRGRCDDVTASDATAAVAAAAAALTAAAPAAATTLTPSPAPAAASTAPSRDHAQRGTAQHNYYHTELILFASLLL